MNILQITYNLFEEKTFIVWQEDNTSCIVIDPGFSGQRETKDFYSTLKNHELKPEAILLTHCHFDHIYGVKSIQDRYGIPVYMHKADEVVIDYCAEMAGRFSIAAPDGSFTRQYVHEGDVVTAAGLSFEVMETPGHTPGGVCYLNREEGVLFSGDTLFAGSIGRTDMKYGEYDDEIRSIMEKIMILDTDTQVYPGHGPNTNIGHERTHNPFLEPFNEPEEVFDPDATPVIISRN